MAHRKTTEIGKVFHNVIGFFSICLLKEKFEKFINREPNYNKKLTIGTKAAPLLM